MFGEIPIPHPLGEFTQSFGAKERRPTISKVEQFNRTLQRLQELDIHNSKIDGLRKQFDRGDQLGKQAERFYEAALSEVGKDFGYTIQRAPESLDYFYPHIDQIMLLPDGNMLGIQNV